MKPEIIREQLQKTLRVRFQPILYRFILILFEKLQLFPSVGTGNFKSNRYNLNFPVFLFLKTLVNLAQPVRPEQPVLSASSVLPAKTGIISIHRSTPRDFRLRGKDRLHRKDRRDGNDGGNENENKKFALKKQKISNQIVILALSACLLSCVSDPLNSTSPAIERGAVKASDPVKQASCGSNRGRICRGDTSCEAVCSAIFQTSFHRRDCRALPRDLVFDFEELIETVKAGGTEDISPDVLECLLDIDDGEFTKALKSLNRREAGIFLLSITTDEETARILEEEDNEFNIFKQLFSRAVSGFYLDRILSEDIADGKSFLQLSAGGSKSGYRWMDSYVEEECDKGDTAKCPGGESIGAYCKALLQLNSKELSVFLSEGALFADEWRGEVKDKGFNYDRKGVRNFCQSLSSS